MKEKPVIPTGATEAFSVSLITTPLPLAIFETEPRARLGHNTDTKNNEDVIEGEHHKITQKGSTPPSHPFSFCPSYMRTRSQLPLGRARTQHRPGAAAAELPKALVRRVLRWRSRFTRNSLRRDRVLCGPPRPPAATAPARLHACCPPSPPPPSHSSPSPGLQATTPQPIPLVPSLSPIPHRLIAFTVPTRA